MQDYVKYIIATLMILSCSSLRGDELHDYHYYKLFEKEESSSDNNETTPISKTEKPNNTLYFNKILYSGRGGMLNGIRLERLSQSEAYRLQLISCEPSALHITESNSRLRLSNCYTIDTIHHRTTSIRAALSTRYALGNIGATTAHSLGKSWNMVADMNIRTGNDAHIVGVFTHEAKANFSFLWRPDSLRSLSIVAMLAPSARGLHGASNREAFNLTGNKLYNPLWGYDKGKVRNSAIRQEFIPTLIGSFKQQLTERSQLIVSLGITAGQNRYSNIDYFDTTTPRPDNHRYLPSNFDNEQVASIVESVWRNGDSRYTQINFEELRLRNSGATTALYAISDRVENLARVQFNATASTRTNKNLVLRYGIEADVEYSRNFKEIGDLLDGGRIADIDFYTLDNATHSKLKANDLRNPTRTVGEDDRFSYDYALTHHQLSAHTSFDYQQTRWNIEGGIKAGYASITRRGYFQKAIFADNSFGRSRNLTFAPFTIYATGNYTPKDGHNLSLMLNISTETNDPQDYFLQSRYNNRTIETPSLRRNYLFEAEYKLSKQHLLLETSLFAHYSTGETQVRQLFDDITYEYCDFITSNISTLHLGLKAEATYQIDRNWRVYGAAIISRHKYAGNALVSIYQDSDNTLVASEIHSFIQGLSVGNSPQIELQAGASFYKQGWRIALEAQYNTLRYIQPSFTRRTLRVLNYTTSPEEEALIMNQERLPDMVSLDLSLSKTFYLRKYDKQIYTTRAAMRFIDRYPRSRITVALYVKNILGRDNNISYAYESSRTPRRYLADGYMLSPHASLYRYDYPRTYYLQIGFSF